MRYKDNEQLKEYIRLVMKRENVTYKELGEKVGTSQQNLHKLLNKKQLKFDDVLMVCDALGYNLSISIAKDSDEQSENEQYAKLEEMQVELSKVKKNIAEMMDNLNKITTE